MIYIVEAELSLDYMNDSETHSLDVDSGEARTIVSALEASRATDDRREQERRENVQRHFQTEFGFGNREETDDSRPGSGIKDLVGGDDSFIGDSESQSIELSREEAKSVAAALAEFNPDNVEEGNTPDSIREQIEATFDLQNDSNR